MSNERARRIQDLFDEARGLSVEDRAVLIAKRCGDDRELAAEVRSLLEHFDAAGEFLESPPLRVLTESTPETAGDVDDGVEGSLAVGQQVDRYRIIEVLGEGGFGIVYLAEQKEPIRRQVALKVIKLGMDTRQVVARFEAERQALALMDHPGVAHVLDAGETAEGRPYFVMDFVSGVPITAYCDRLRLSTEDRLELMIRVCEAIEHAHQKGIIHRDIKPSNVLVTSEGSAPAPRVIDFGIAKAIHQPLTDSSLHTAVGQFIGTPEYMSPEQVESGFNIDTRADIYALGVVLYELLVGSRPFGFRERALSFAEMQQAICEIDPARPSTRLSESSTDAVAIARRHRLSPSALKRRLRGDLDWIVMKALEKDRTRRYATASELAADIRRHLDRQPVLAGPPSVAYIAGKFLRRHTGLVASVVVVFLALLAGAIGVTWQTLEIAEQRDRAVEAERLAQRRQGEAEAARGEAERDRDKADQLFRFLQEVLWSADPAISRGEELTVRRVLERAAADLETKMAGQEESAALLHATIGWTYYRLGLWNEADPHLTTAFRTLQRLRGHDDLQTLKAMSNVAMLRWAQERRSEAEPLLRDALRFHRAHADRDPAATLTATASLGSFLRAQGELEEATSLLESVVDGRRALFGGAHVDTLRAQHNLAAVLVDRKLMERAESLLRDTLAARRRILGAADPETLASLHNLAQLLWQRGELAEAETLAREAHSGREEVLGARHPATLRSLDAVAAVLKAQDKLLEAEEVQRQAHSIRDTELGPDHADTVEALHNLAAILKARGMLDEAEPLLERVVEASTRGLGVEHWYTAYYRVSHGRCLLAMGKHAEAEERLLAAHRRLVEVFGEGHGYVVVTVRSLVELYEAWGKPDEAAAWRAKLP